MIDKKYPRYDDEDEDELWDNIPEATERREEPIDSEMPEMTSRSDSYSDEDSSSDFESDSEDDTNIDTEPERPKTVNTSSKRKSIFSLGEEEDDDDFFNNDTDPEPAPKPRRKQVKLDPEDPDYWVEEESEFPAILPKPKKIWKWWLGAVVIMIAAIIGLWIWFFHPYVDEAVKYGYIKSMERRGTFVKTFEGVLIPYRELGDKTPTYFEEINFSVDGDSLAARMKGMMLECVPVRIEYEAYHTPLFWKGAAPMVVVKVDTADVNKILPPEYR